jgi:AbrB family looped-hinge helix DNA binding protein
MLEFRAQLTEGGRIIIPAKCRQALHLSIGDEVIIRVVDNEAHIYSLQHAIKRAQALVTQRNKKKLKLTDMLIKERRSETKNE